MTLLVSVPEIPCCLGVRNGQVVGYVAGNDTSTQHLLDTFFKESSPSNRSSTAVLPDQNQQSQPEEIESAATLHDHDRQLQTEMSQSSAVPQDEDHNQSQISATSSEPPQASVAESSTILSIHNPQSPTISSDALTKSHEALQPSQRNTYERAKHVDETRRKRETEAEERRRVLAMIEADRRARSGATNASAGASAPRTKSMASSSSSGQSKKDSCLLNIRLLDGSAIRETFSPSANLGNVRQYIDANLAGKLDAPYEIARTFPTHTYTAQEESQELRKLDLFPSATLVLKVI